MRNELKYFIQEVVPLSAGTALMNGAAEAYNAYADPYSMKNTEANITPKAAFKKGLKEGWLFPLVMGTFAAGFPALGKKLDAAHMKIKETNPGHTFKSVTEETERTANSIKKILRGNMAFDAFRNLSDSAVHGISGHVRKRRLKKEAGVSLGSYINRPEIGIPLSMGLGILAAKATSSRFARNLDKEHADKLKKNDLLTGALIGAAAYGSKNIVGNTAAAVGGIASSTIPIGTRYIRLRAEQDKKENIGF